MLKMTYTQTVLLLLMPHRMLAETEHANGGIVLEICGREGDWWMARGKQRVFREELCTMAGPNCLRLL